MTWKLSNNPRGWQSKALESWITRGFRGIAKIVTGGGKTFFSFMCIRDMNEKYPHLKFIILVPTVALRDQWTLDLIDDLSVERDEIYVHGMDKRFGINHKIVLMVINSARTHLDSIIGQGEWMLIVDECHRAASEKNRTAIDRAWSATLGLSATPERQYDDWFEEYLIPNLGEIIANYDYVDAKKDGVISEFELRNYSVPMLENEESEMNKIGRLIVIEKSKLAKKGLTESPKLLSLYMKRSRISQSLAFRVPLAVKICSQFLGKKIIIFHESIAQVDLITKLLDEQGFRVASYHSKLSPMTRISNLDFFRKGIKDVLVTCRALDEGLNVKDVEVGMIVASTKSTRQRIQRMGRVLRTTDEKENAIVISLYSVNEKNNLLTEAKKFEDIIKISWYGDV